MIRPNHSDLPAEKENRGNVINRIIIGNTDVAIGWALQDQLVFFDTATWTADHATVLQDGTQIMQEDLPKDDSRAETQPEGQSAFELKDAVDRLVTYIERNQIEHFERELISQQARLDPIILIDQLLAPMMRRIGERWYQHRVRVYQEHAASEFVSNLLKTLPELDMDPRETILLATPAGEQHSLGLALVNYAMRLANAHCINLGANLPVEELIKAIDGYNPDIVCISFSAGADSGESDTYLNQVAEQISSRSQIWVGGDAVSRLKHIPNRVKAFSTVGQSFQALIDRRSN